MRKPVWRIDGTDANAEEGTVVWAPAKSLWNSLMYAVASSQESCRVCSGQAQKLLDLAPSVLKVEL